METKSLKFNFFGFKFCFLYLFLFSASLTYYISSFLFYFIILFSLFLVSSVLTRRQRDVEKFQGEIETDSRSTPKAVVRRSPCGVLFLPQM